MIPSPGLPTMLRPLPLATAHLSEEILEEYRFRRLSEREIEALEEHLLICPQCCEALKKIDEFASAVRMYAARAPASAGRMTWARGVGMGSVIAAAALGLTVATIRPATHSVSATRVVQLVTFRGGDGQAAIPARADALVSLDLIDLTPDAVYRVEIVDAQGQRTWTGQSQASGGQLKIHLSSGLRPGAYWIRLYSTDELVREFGLRAQ